VDFPIMKKLSFCALLLSFSASALSLHAFQVTPIVHENISPRLALEEHKEVFVAAFTQSYVNQSLDFSEEGLCTLLNNGFENEIVDFEKQPDSSFFYQATTEEGKVIGFSSFEVNKEEKSAYLRRIAVAPGYEHQGVGKRLTFKICDEGVKHIFVMTRRANTLGINFYEHRGFEKSPFTREKMDPELYVSLEWHE